MGKFAPEAVNLGAQNQKSEIRKLQYM